MLKSMNVWVTVFSIDFILKYVTESELDEVINGFLIIRCFKSYRKQCFG